ncbi:hypothetical protein Ac2012v2_005241 [Leucoagaricus gongylophorus]
MEMCVNLILMPSHSYPVTALTMDPFEGSINSRINILHFLDSLCETCQQLKSRPVNQNDDSSSKFLYIEYLARDLPKIIELVAPDGRQGLPNLSSTKQILESWRTKRMIDPKKLDEILSSLNSRTNTKATGAPQPNLEPQTQDRLSRNDVFKRFEEDRERHKRLRERRWVQTMSHDTNDYRALSLACFLPLSGSADGNRDYPFDIEFENDWDTVSDWNEDDDEAAVEESDLCFRIRDSNKDLIRSTRKSDYATRKPYSG